MIFGLITGLSIGAMLGDGVAGDLDDPVDHDLVTEEEQKRPTSNDLNAICSWCVDTADVEIQIENDCNHCDRCGRKLHQ